MYAVFQSNDKPYKQGEPCTEADHKRILKTLSEDEGEQGNVYFDPDIHGDGEDYVINSYPRSEKKRKRVKMQKASRRKNRKKK